MQERRLHVDDDEARLTVLHITADYPDVNNTDTTVAVQNFIGRNDEVDHVVVAIHRTALPWRVRVTEGGRAKNVRLISIRYWALPYGVLLETSIYLLYWMIASIVRSRDIGFDVIHAHKLTFEGLAAYWLSHSFRKPYVISVRGEVEDKVLRAKPHFAWLYRRVVRDCARIFYVSAWFRPQMKARYGVDASKERLLPNFVDASRANPQVAFRRNALVSVMSFDIYKRKGLEFLLPAFKGVVAQVPDATLDLIGGGRPADLQRVRGLIEGEELSQCVRLVGPLPNQELMGRLGSYCGFVLPSRNETFGMVYVEALLNGIPIVYSKNTGIDGHIDGVRGAIGIDPYSIESIRDGMLQLLANQETFRDRLREQRQLVEHRFDAMAHVAAYNDELRAVVTGLAAVTR